MNLNLLLEKIHTTKVNYQKIIENSVCVLYCQEKEFDINFVVPVRGRFNFTKPMYNSFCAARNKVSGVSIIYTVVEFSDSSEHAKFCKDNKINYIWIPCEKDDMFNKCLAMNVGALFGGKAKSFIFHDLDCLIQSDFFIKLNENVKKTKSNVIQCFNGRRVLYLNEQLTANAINWTLDIDNLSLDIDGVSLPFFIGAPGGSIFIEKELFEFIGGYDPELFCGNSPEDAFFWEKIKTATGDDMPTANNPKIDIFHMNHTVTYYNNPRIDEMKNYYETFKDLTFDEKVSILKLKKQLLKDFVND
jgi:hypothetical protein